MGWKIGAWIAFLLHYTWIIWSERIGRLNTLFLFQDSDPFQEGLEPKVAMNDRELVQLICAYRLFNQEVELSLSTRETHTFRNHAIKLGITSMSAGSKTNPGGYAVEPESLEQFEISDERSPAEVKSMLEQSGYEPVWKDWDCGAGVTNN